MRGGPWQSRCRSMATPSSIVVSHRPEVRQEPCGQVKSFSLVLLGHERAWDHVEGPETITTKFEDNVLTYRCQICHDGGGSTTGAPIEYIFRSWLSQGVWE